MSNKKKKYLQAQEQANGKKRPAPTMQEAKRYMLITWLCTIVVGFMVFGRTRWAGQQPTALHYILLGILLIVSFAMTEGFIKAGVLAKDKEDEGDEGRRHKG